MKILLVSDAWFPQVNGVVTTLSHVVEEWQKLGHQVEVIHPGDYASMPLWGYREIRLCWPTARTLIKRIEDFAPEVIHVATEGPLGFRLRHLCVKKNWPFTTSFHTLFAEYLNARIPLIPVSWGYAYLRWFHRAAHQTLVTTESIRENLSERGFSHLSVWTRGIDFSIFNPGDVTEPRPVREAPRLVYVGRVSVEKNLPAFLECECPGEKWVVGDGPALEAYKKTYPQAVFVGKKTGEALAKMYREADVMVFPSRTDTFGLVMIESMACGTPVAAFPVQGPVDVVSQEVNGVLDQDLSEAIESALKLDRAGVAASVQHMTWQACAKQLLDAMVDLDSSVSAKAIP
jgi:glycosyltransferase involved in cell wall biosynthesis